MFRPPGLLFGAALTCRMLFVSHLLPPPKRTRLAPPFTRTAFAAGFRFVLRRASAWIAFIFSHTKDARLGAPGVP
jgi:hypothetical protein